MNEDEIKNAVKEANRLGLEVKFQPTANGGMCAYYNDPKTLATIMPLRGETVEQALERKRFEFVQAARGNG